MKFPSCVKLLFPGVRAPAPARAEEPGSGSLRRRRRVCPQVQFLEQAGLAVIDNYLVTDISVPASSHWMFLYHVRV